MEASVLIERIRGALAAGELVGVPTTSSFKSIETFADLLLPWSEVFPGMPEPEDGESFDLFGYQGLMKPVFTPGARRSFRPLPPPRPIAASPRMVSPGLFGSVRGIWDWYGANELAAPALIAHPFTENGLLAFIQPLFDAVGGYWPMHVPLEMLFEDYCLAELPCIKLMLPHYSYEEEGVSVLEAFLSGPDSIASIMQHMDSNPSSLTDLSAKDRALVDKIGYPRLLQAYADFGGKKTYDIGRFETFGEVWFGPVTEKFPEQAKNDYPIISGNSGYDAEVMITCRADIEFCFAHASAYYDLMEHLPNPYEFENNDGGLATRFAAELCEIWRKTKNKPPEPSRCEPIPLAIQFGLETA